MRISCGRRHGCCCWCDGRRGREDLIEIERGVFGSVFEAERDLVVGESGLRIRSILGLKLAGAQRGFDGSAQFAADAIETARDAGFMLAEFAADVRERLLVGVVEAEAAEVLWVESFEGLVERVGKEREVARAVRVGRGVVSGIGEGGCGVDGSDAFPIWNSIVGRGSGLVFDLDEAARCPDGIDMALCENGAEPGFQRAAAVEVAEERAIFGFAGRGRGDAVEVGEERIGEVLRGDRIGLASKDGGSGSAKVAAVGDDEKFPGGRLAAGACGGEAQILEVKRAEKFVELFAGDLLRAIAGGEAFCGAAFERIFETLARN